MHLVRVSPSAVSSFSKDSKDDTSSSEVFGIMNSLQSYFYLVFTTMHCEHRRAWFLIFSLFYVCCCVKCRANGDPNRLVVGIGGIALSVLVHEPVCTTLFHDVSVIFQ